MWAKKSSISQNSIPTKNKSQKGSFNSNFEILRKSLPLKSSCVIKLHIRVFFLYTIFEDYIIIIIQDLHLNKNIRKNSIAIHHFIYLLQ